MYFVSAMVEYVYMLDDGAAAASAAAATAATNAASNDKRFSASLTSFWLENNMMYAGMP